MLQINGRFYESETSVTNIYKKVKFKSQKCILSCIKLYIGLSYKMIRIKMYIINQIPFRKMEEWATIYINRITTDYEHLLFSANQWDIHTQKNQKLL